MIMQYNDYHSQVSSAWFDNKFIGKSLHNETNFNKCEFTGKTEGNVSWRLESAREGPNTTSIAQFALLPLVKPDVWFARAVVKWRSRYVAKSAYLRLSIGLQKFAGGSKSEI